MVQLSSRDIVSKASLHFEHKVSVNFSQDRWWVPELAVQRSQVNEASPIWIDGCKGVMNAILLLSPLHLVWDFRRYFMSAPEVGFLYVGRVWRGKTQQGRAVYKKWLPYENCKSNHPKINIILNLYHMKLIRYNAERKLLMLHPKVRKNPRPKLLSSLFWIR